jgi:hypothetical protein
LRGPNRKAWHITLAGGHILYSKVAKVANLGTHPLGNLGAKNGNLGAQIGDLGAHSGNLESFYDPNPAYAWIGNRRSQSRLSMTMLRRQKGLLTRIVSQFAPVASNDAAVNSVGDSAATWPST